MLETRIHLNTPFKRYNSFLRKKKRNDIYSEDGTVGEDDELRCAAAWSARKRAKVVSKKAWVKKYPERTPVTAPQERIGQNRQMKTACGVRGNAQTPHSIVLFLPKPMSLEPMMARTGQKLW
jgi:hypothetical protein